MALLRLLGEAGIGHGCSKEEGEEGEEGEEEGDQEEETSSSSSFSSSSSSSSSSLLVPPKNGWLHKILICAHFKKTLDLIESLIFQHHLPGVQYLRLDGSVPSR